MLHLKQSPTDALFIKVMMLWKSYKTRYMITNAGTIWQITRTNNAYMLYQMQLGKYPTTKTGCLEKAECWSEVLKISHSSANASTPQS